MSSPPPHAIASATELTAGLRRWILIAAFLSWFGAGTQMGLTTLLGPPAVQALLPAAPPDDASAEAARTAEVGKLFADQMAALSFGAALGGVVFGRFADRRGRSRALALSVVTYACGTGLSAASTSVAQLLALRFVTGLGIGGTWPAAVALAGEAWPGTAKARVAGVIGMSANVGILAQALLVMYAKAHGGVPIGVDNWRQVSLVGATPLVIGLAVALWLPESPRWLALRTAATIEKPAAPLAALFGTSLRRRTLVGIGLATVPLLGAWGSGKWLIPWAGTDSARTQAVWAFGAVLASAAGGYVADRFGRRITYFVVSATTLAVNLSIYRYLTPNEPEWFLPAAFLSGVSGTIFFGWLPLYLPELFPTRVRATGIGLTYNAGRIATGLGILAAGQLLRHYGGSFQRVGEVTSWVYAFGMLVILFAPSNESSSDSEESAPDKARQDASSR